MIWTVSSIFKLAALSCSLPAMLAELTCIWTQVHLPALSIQQIKNSSWLLIDQLNAATVVRAVYVLPGDALWHIIFLKCN